MKLRLLTGLVVFQLIISVTYGQSMGEQVLDAYFHHLTRQHQLQRAISSALLQISPELHRTYEQLDHSAEGDTDLQWTYFLEKLERIPAAAAALEQCRLERQLNTLIKRFQHFSLIDPFGQSAIDTSRSMRRLQFFNLAEGQRVAEIGFGYGYNLNLLGLVYDSLRILASELDRYRLNKMKEEVQQTYPADRSDNFEFVPGAIASTQLEGRDLDLIIMENVLHHIEAQTDFIHSILASISIDGSVVVIEEFSDTARPEGHCPDLMPRGALERLFQQAGFFIEREEALGYKTMLRFARVERSE